ncbi:class I SAM-dependent methyltransferase [Microlunatus speluncae]|uniref:class I SAM-dependent methyltransferase n=1 Tax=Microlunatus speluncae TaxID=2594267 RepID=UPI002483B463|nr:class I SAM-dependent methyltransferase [Microlunatus speluncae]
MDEHSKINLAFWDEVTPHHARSDHYAIERFIADPDRLGAVESAEIGDVSGRSICHLQCHLGLDTLSLAHRGGTVTGVDFSAESIKFARELSIRTGIPARFVQSDVLTAAETLGETYDLVFTTRGVLMWIGDLAAWARSCARLLRPGGVFYLLDLHPLGMLLQQTGAGLELTGSYFGSAEPSITAEDASYAVSDVGLTHQETHEWIHPVGKVLTALIDAGIMIDFLHEHPADDHAPTTLSPTDTAPGIPDLPALYSIRGHLPQTARSVP